MLSLAALADPTRRRIVEILAEGQLSSGEIADRFEISAPAVSQHLKVLKRAYLVRARVDGQRRIYELDPAGFAELQAWLGHVTHFWQSRLDRLERQLAEAHGGETQTKRRKKKGS